jgi:hypothetical protein
MRFVATAAHEETYRCHRLGSVSAGLKCRWGLVSADIEERH